ncbi:sigma-54 interaction domain-containing protein [Oscillospiraceae bacterium LTW-04]|nr:sigma 54-interacting transcriptional regulator [Oscillospiraceae bacterium MB24-C1]
MAKRDPAYFYFPQVTEEPPMFRNLREARARFETIIESSYDGIYITDGHAITMMINKSYEDISGLDRRELLGTRMDVLVGSGVISRSGTLEALKAREPVTIEQVFKTGKRAIITSTPVFDDKQEIVMVVTNVRDVTELHALKEELAQNREMTSKYFKEIEAMRRTLPTPAEMIAVDKAMRDVLQQAKRIATLNIPVLLSGEQGVGKAQLSQYIHERSNRKGEKFVRVCCKSIPPKALEGELFGYDDGAGSGKGRMGLIEAADRGTIHIDEIADLPLDVQGKLLLLLKEQRIERIGAEKPITVDVRVIAGTNHKIAEMVREKEFLEELYYRLNVVTIHVPPLRERREDIMPFVQSFVMEVNRKYRMKKRFSSASMSALKGYAWLGNVRELRSVVERAMLMSEGSVIETGSLSIPLGSEAPSAPEKSFESANLKALVAQLELSYIEKAYERYGNVRDAAKSLGIDAATLVRKRRHHKERFSMQK